MPTEHTEYTEAGFLSGVRWATIVSSGSGRERGEENIVLKHGRVDLGWEETDGAWMTNEGSSEAREVTVREVPIELCQFIKFGGLADSGGAAKQLVAEGGVMLNGVVETRKRKKLAAGDRVTVAGETIVVRVG